MHNNSYVHSLIIGAGLTGLSTAHFLQKNNKTFRVLEKKGFPGGVINTNNERGFVYETGPNTGVLGSGEIVEVFEDLNDRCQLETANEKAQKRYILKNGSWQPLPGGLISAITTPLYTFSDKLRLLGEPFRKRGNNPHESLASLVKRRMGQSFLDYAIDPFIIGVYAGDPEVLIPKYALPKLYNLEQNYGSFIGGAIKKHKEPKTDYEKKANRKVFSVRGGFNNLVNALVGFSGHENFCYNIKDLKIYPENGHYKVSWTEKGEQQKIIAENVIFTGGSHELPGIFPFIPDEEIKKLTLLYYAKVSIVSLGFDKWIGINLDGFGGLIPSMENRDILGILFMSTLFEGRAPEDGALLSVFMGGMRKPEMAEMDNDLIMKTVEREITSLMKLPSFNPQLFRITRYEHAIPQYDVNSGVRFETINRLEQQFPGLILGGNMRDGIGMADRVKQGKILAMQAINRL